MKDRDWIEWMKRAGMRAVKTMAQTAVALLRLRDSGACGSGFHVHITGRLARGKERRI